MQFIMVNHHYHIIIGLQEMLLLETGILNITQHPFQIKRADIGNIFH